MKKRLLAILLCLCMVVTLLPTMAFAEGTALLTMGPWNGLALDLLYAKDNETMIYSSQSKTIIVGTVVTLVASTRSGWRLVNWTMSPAETEITPANGGTATFTMPDENITISPNVEQFSVNQSVSGDVLSWDNIDGLTNPCVRFYFTSGGVTRKECESTSDQISLSGNRYSCDLKSVLDSHAPQVSGNYSITIAWEEAYLEGTPYTYAGSITQLSTPGNPHWDTTESIIARWDAVAGASSYKIAATRNSIVIGMFTTSDTSYDFGSKLMAGQNMQFDVTAIPEDTINFSQSNAAESDRYTVPENLYVQPTITTQPQSVTKEAGESASFTIAASGYPVPNQFRWEVSKNGGTTWAAIPGSSGTTYTIDSVTEEMNSWQYRGVALPRGGGQSEAVSNSANLTFTNLDSPPSAEVPITVIKSIVGVGAKLTENTTFTFTLAKATEGANDYDGVTMPSSLTVTTESMKTGSAEPVSFGNIKFEKAGTYEFTVTETNSKIPGLAYTDPQTVWIKTKIHNDGTKDVMSYEFVDANGATITTGGRLTFNNTYAPTPATITSEQLNVKKTIDFVGKATALPTAEAFTFTLARSDNGAADAVTMPTVSTTTTAAIASGTSAAVGFGDITFHAAGTYTFSVIETQGNTPGLTYAGPQTVTVMVTDYSGKLYAKIKENDNVIKPASGELTFTNTYAPEEAKITSAELNITKTVEGHILPKPKTFTFRLTRTDGGDDNAVKMPALTTTTEAISFGDAAAIGFDDITFKAEGTYTFSILEDSSGIDQMTDAEAQTVTVKVTRDTNGKLAAKIIKSTMDETVESGALIFTNTYAPNSVTPADPPVQKIVDGAFAPATADTFTFVLTPIRYTAPDDWTNAMTAAQMPVPAATEITITGAASKDFGTYEYKIAGTYEYTITEKAGTNPDYTYDNSVYTYTDVVTDDNGTLKCTRTITKPGVTTNPTAAVFTNTYTRPMGKLTVSKTVTGGDNSNALFTFNFTFSEATRYNYVKSDATTGTIATGESIQLKNGESVTISIHQGVTYTVIEDAYTSYIPTPTDRTFSGTISTTESKADYTNRYEEPYTPPTLTGNLTVKGEVIGANADITKGFAFTVTLSDETINGTYGDMSFVNGVATFSLKDRESKTAIELPAGVEYLVEETTNSQYKATSEDASGSIVANETKTAAFTNEYASVPATGDNSYMVLWLALLFLSGGVLTALGISQKRKKANSK